MNENNFEPHKKKLKPRKLNRKAGTEMYQTKTQRRIRTAAGKLKNRTKNNKATS